MTRWRAANWLGALAVVVGVGLVIWRPLSERYSTYRAWATVQTTLSAETRPLEPRLSEITYKPWRPVRSAPAERTRFDADLLSAAATLERIASGPPSASNYRRAAIADLIIEEPDRAVGWLERGVVLAPGDAALRSDLAAAYLIRGERRRSTVDVVRALDAATRAVMARPDAAEAWFNRGLALNLLGLSAQSVEAFNRAASEPTDWAAEARSRADLAPSDPGRAALLARSEAVVVDGDPDALRRAASSDVDLVAEILERRLLERWADAVVRDDPAAAARWLGRARAVAAAVSEAIGDQHSEVLVAALGSCGRCYAQGWLHHLEALRAWDEDRFADIRAPAERADHAFGTDLGVVNVTRLPLRVTIARLDGRGADARRWLAESTPYSQHRQFLSLSGRLLWQQALLASEAGDFSAALGTYHQALRTLERARDREGASVVAALLGYEHLQLDDLDTAWQLTLSALQRFPFDRPLRRGPVLSIAAMLAASTGLPAAALVFRSPVVVDAQRNGKVNTLPFRLIEDAVSYQQLGERARAQESLDGAAASLSAIRDPGTLGMARGRVFAAEGRFLLQEQPQRAAERLQAAIEVARIRGDIFAIPALQLDYGRALDRLGRQDDARRAFHDGVDVAERSRQMAATDADRVAALSARWDLYATLVDSYIRRNEDAAALQFLRRGRAANLLEEVGATGPLEALPAGTVTIEYVVLPTNVVAWIGVGDHRRRFDLDVDGRALEEAIAEFRSAIKGRRDYVAMERLAKHLYATLLGPARPELEGAKRLVLVPDGPLHAVPFAALRDEAGRPLIERVAVIVTPSLSFYLAQRGEPSLVRDRALIVGNPDRTGAVGETLPPLPGAESEARAIAAFYTGPLLLTGPAASRRAFLEQAPSASLIHFAGHAIASERRTESSRLLLAPASDDPVGAVFAKDLVPGSLPKVRLVVLSACETARGQVARGEGVNGLVRAFLRAGAPTVVATLWPVDDRAAAALFREFHRRLAAGGHVEDALRGAQLEILRMGWTDPADWAAPTVNGRLTPPFPAQEHLHE